MSKTDGGVIIVFLPFGSNSLTIEFIISLKAINVKPVSYSVIKHGIIGLTKCLATYWADKIFELIVFVCGVMKVKIKLLLKNFKSHTSKENGWVDEYKGAIQFLVQMLQAI